METRIIRVIAQRELREALSNKWLWFYAAGFILLAFGLSQAGLSTAGYAGLGGFGRTAASLVNALLLFVPLMGLTTGAQTFVHDAERGTLLYLLAQPINRAELFWGKVLGATLAVLVALSVGFGVTALGLRSAGAGQLMAYANLTLSTGLLALIMLGLGFSLSCVARRTSAASSSALMVWLLLVFLGDLSLIGAVIALRPTPAVLLGLLLLNPLQTYKLAAIYGLQSSLDTLGPVGQYATYQFGSQLSPLLWGWLLLWVLLTFAGAFVLFQKRGDL